VPRYAEVAVPVPVKGTFHYRVPDEVSAEPLATGSRVKVPFGRRRLEGYILREATEAEAVEAAGGAGRIKDVISVSDPEPLLSEELLRLAVWISGYYRSALGEALAAMLPAGVRKGAKAERVKLVQGAAPPDELKAEAEKRRRRAPKQAQLLDMLAGITRPTQASLLLAEADAGAGSLEALARDGLSRIWSERAEVSAAESARETAGAAEGAGARVEHTLTDEQARSLDEMTSSLDGGFAVHLVHGVTGSGKTELYIRLMEEVIRRGKGAIVLVPEIALTPQTSERFAQAFGDVAVLHSHLTEGQRAEEWRSVRRGERRVVIGARSAVFAPVEPLGLIVIDEEHETSFKQESSPRYHARDVAVMRAQLAGATVVLGSATPSLESYRNALAGKYRHLELTRRVERRPLPEVEVVDMAAERLEAKRFVRLSRRLVKLTEEALGRGEQAIYFLNRRGFATFLTCPQCGWVATCPDCSVTLIYHKKRNALVCHYCGRVEAAVKDCPQCLFRDVPYWGFGTERIEEEIAAAFGGAPVARMDSDTMTDRRSYERTLAAFRRGEIRILVGTQMIAKGLDFPEVTLVGIINADVAMNLPDFRATERTFQLIAQVAGRTGRGSKGGRVVVQTMVPRHAAIVAARSHGYEEFARREMAFRRDLLYPPFTRLARVVLSGEHVEHVKMRAGQVARAITQSARAASPDCVVMGPATAPLAVIAGRHRCHVVLKAPDSKAVAAVLDGAEGALKKRSGVTLTLDVDPVAML